MLQDVQNIYIWICVCVFTLCIGVMKTMRNGSKVKRLTLFLSISLTLDVYHEAGSRDYLIQCFIFFSWETLCSNKVLLGSSKMENRLNGIAFLFEFGMGENDPLLPFPANFHWPSWTFFFLSCFFVCFFVLFCSVLFLFLINSGAVEKERETQEDYSDCTAGWWQSRCHSFKISWTYLIY